MPKEEGIELEGEVIQNLPGDKFKVRLENNMEIICTISGRIRLSGIKLVTGDKVKVTISPYDLTQGRITWRIS